MKGRFLLIFLAGFWISSYCQVSTKIDTISKDLYYSEIMDSTFVIIHKFPGSCNSMFVLPGDKKGVLIDTPNETTGTKSLLDWIDMKFGEFYNNDLKRYHQIEHFDTTILIC